MRAFSLYNPLRLSDDLLPQRLSDDLLQQENAKFVISVFLTLSQKKIQSNKIYWKKLTSIRQPRLLPTLSSSTVWFIWILWGSSPHPRPPTFASTNEEEATVVFIILQKSSRDFKFPVFHVCKSICVNIFGDPPTAPFCVFRGAPQKVTSQLQVSGHKEKRSREIEGLSQIGIVITPFQPTESRGRLSLPSSEHNYLCFRCLGFSSGPLPRYTCFRSQHSNKHPHDSATSGTPISVVCWFLRINYDIPKKSSKKSKKKILPRFFKGSFFQTLWAFVSSMARAVCTPEIIEFPDKLL